MRASVAALEAGRIGERMAHRARAACRTDSVAGMAPEDSLVEWSTQFERDGRVGLDIQRRALTKDLLRLVGLLLISAACVVVTSVLDQPILLIAFVVVLITLPGAAYQEWVAWTAPSPALVIDGSGVHFRGRVPLDVHWDEIVDDKVVRHPANREPVGLLVIAPTALAEHRGHHPRVLRALLALNRWGSSSTWLIRSIYGVPGAELAQWIIGIRDRMEPDPPDLEQTYSP